MENLINDYTRLGGQDYMARLILREKGEDGLRAAIAELTGQPSEVIEAAKSSEENEAPTEEQPKGKK